MTRIDIPAALRREISADLALDARQRWQPNIEPGAYAICFGVGPRAEVPSSRVGMVQVRVGTPDPDNWRRGTMDFRASIVGRSREGSRRDPTPCLSVHDDQLSFTSWAWAPVGGTDGGPRPAEGDRILVLTDAGGDCPEPWIGHVTYASWGNLPIGAVMSGGVTPLAAQESAVTRWAILPPEVPAEVHALRADLDQALDVVTGLAQIIGPDQPVDPLTANPDHTWPCADYCCTRGCPGIGNTLHGPPWPCDATRCTCGNDVIRAVAHDRQRLAALVPGLETANHGLHNRNRALRDERDRARRIAVALEQELAQLRSWILDRPRDQGLDVETPHVREGLATP